jgi:2-methylcitrate dehydratase PrpD
VEVVCDQELDGRFPGASLARVTIETTGGEKFTSNPSLFTKGDYQNPLTGPELKRKFRRYAGCAIPDQQIDSILQKTEMIEVLPNVSELTQHLLSKTKMTKSGPSRSLRNAEDFTYVRKS